MKDKKNYADVVDILSVYEDAIEDIFVKVGVTKKPDKNKTAVERKHHLISLTT